MTTPLVGSDVVRLEQGTYMWVQITRFSLDPSLDDRAILVSLIASSGYAHDYCSPVQLEAEVVEPAVHGRWWRDQIHAGLFEPWSPADAETLIRRWADQRDLTGPDYRQPPEVHARLQSVYKLLRSGHLYKLVNPGTEAEHDFGFVTGSMGFHEFIALDRTSGLVHVIVASDD